MRARRPTAVKMPARMGVRDLEPPDDDDDDDDEGDGEVDEVDIDEVDDGGEGDLEEHVSLLAMIIQKWMYDEVEGVFTWIVMPGKDVGMVIPPMEDGRVIDRLMSRLVGIVKLGMLICRAASPGAGAVGVGVGVGKVIVQV